MINVIFTITNVSNSETRLAALEEGGETHSLARARLILILTRFLFFLFLFLIIKVEIIILFKDNLMFMRFCPSSAVGKIPVCLHE